MYNCANNIISLFDKYNIDTKKCIFIDKSEIKDSEVLDKYLKINKNNILLNFHKIFISTDILDEYLTINNYGYKNIIVSVENGCRHYEVNTENEFIKDMNKFIVHSEYNNIYFYKTMPCYTINSKFKLPYLGKIRNIINNNKNNNEKYVFMYIRNDTQNVNFHKIINFILITSFYCMYSNITQLSIYTTKNICNIILNNIQILNYCNNITNNFNNKFNININIVINNTIDAINTINITINDYKIDYKFV